MKKVETETAIQDEVLTPRSLRRYLKSGERTLTPSCRAVRSLISSSVGSGAFAAVTQKCSSAALSEARMSNSMVVPTSPSEGQGLVHNAYRATGRHAHNDESLLSPSQTPAHVTFAVGGSVSAVSFVDSEARDRLGPPHGGGLRGEVSGFSRASRMRLLRRLARINRAAFRAFEGRVLSVTLTYPQQWPEDVEVSKRHLRALYKRLAKRSGEFPGFWRLGIQQRGAWHFHLLLFVPPSFGSLKELRSFVASSWYEVCGKISNAHLLASTKVEEIRKWRAATSYVEKYMARPEQFPEGMKTGRIWGAWHEEMLPVW
jgi:hypothetical protein